MDQQTNDGANEELKEGMKEGIVYIIIIIIIIIKQDGQAIGMFANSRSRSRRFRITPLATLGGGGVVANVNLFPISSL